jgi:tripartite-type tricarboxylate transporter receptor subunit TctC
MGTKVKAALAFFMAAGSMVTNGPTVAQTYPVKPVRLIVPYAPGGNGEILARVYAEKLAGALGQQVVVDNRAGANGIIGTELCAKAFPDGYTLLFAASGHVTNPSLYGKLPYDSVRDFAAIGHTASSPLLITVALTVPAKSVNELIALARAQPGKLNYGTAGTASSGHLSAILLGTMAKVDIVHVPYKSVATATTDLIAGQIQLMFPSLPSALPHVKAGRVRALAITTAQRSPLLPEMPAVAESGLPGYAVSIWTGMLGPAGLPRPIVVTLNAHLRDIARSADVRERFASLGADPLWSTPEALSAFIRTETAKWNSILRSAGVRPD